MQPERRKFSRIERATDRRVPVMYAGLKEDVAVMDVSASGMRVALSRQTAVGDSIFGKIQIMSEIGPFFVKGTVIRVSKKDGAWETAVRFDRVATTPLLPELQ